jgi:Xaa-Pro aminopeptidase
MITRILLLTLATSVAALHAEEKPQGEAPKRERRGPSGPGERPMGGLTSEEAQKVREAMQAVKDEPAVVAAREAARKASEAMRAAREEGKSREEMAPLAQAAREANQAAMKAAADAAVAKDPSVKALFDKLRAARENAGDGAQRGPRPERKRPEGAPKKDA